MNKPRLRLLTPSEGYSYTDRWVINGGYTFAITRPLGGIDADYWDEIKFVMEAVGAI